MLLTTLLTPEKPNQLRIQCAAKALSAREAMFRAGALTIKTLATLAQPIIP